MKLQDIFEQLTFGELKQVSIGGYSEGGVQQEDYPELINHINIALTTLYIRFPLREKEVLLQTRLGQTLYELDPKYAYSQVDDPEVDLWYIDDSNQTFLDDISRINAVYDAYGNEVPLNDMHQANSIFASSFDTIQVPYATGAEIFSIVYRAEPTKLVYTTDTEGVHSTDLEADAQIPQSLMEPLLTYIEHRVHKARGGTEGMQQAQIAKAHYEALCTEIEKKNVLNNGLSNTNIKPELNGWT